MQKLPIETLPVVAVPELSPAARLLWEAAQHLDRHGWCRFSVNRTDGKKCVVGAFYAVMERGNYDWVTYQAAGDLIINHTGFCPAPELGTGNARVMVWNDDQPDASTVIQALRDAALS